MGTHLYRTQLYPACLQQARTTRRPTNQHARGSPTRSGDIRQNDRMENPCKICLLFSVFARILSLLIHQPSVQQNWCLQMRRALRPCAQPHLYGRQHTHDGQGGPQERWARGGGRARLTRRTRGPPGTTRGNSLTPLMQEKVALASHPQDNGELTQIINSPSKTGQWEKRHAHKLQ